VHNNVARPASFQQQTASLRQTMQQNHVGAITAGGRSDAGESGGFRGSTTSGTASGNMKPSAGTFAAGTSGGREANSNVSRPLTPPSTHSTESTGTERAGVGSSNMQRGVTPPGSAGRNDGFRPFTPPPSSRSDVARGESNLGSERGSERDSSGGSYWNRTAPSSQMHTNGPVYGGSERSYSRPQLDMRQPIARPPSGGYGGYRGAPSYHAPSYGGSHAAPSYGGSRGASGGGHVSAPSGGGHSSGGGGGHASSGGGGHSGGGHH